MSRALLKTVFLISQLGLIWIGIKSNPILIVGIPLLLIAFIWLLYNPGISLLFLAMTGIIKGFLIRIFPVFEVIDYTLLFTIIIWIGLFRLFLIGEWKIPLWSKQFITLYMLFSIVLLFSGFYTPSPNYGWQKIGLFLIFNTTMFITPFIIIKKVKDSVQILSTYIIILILMYALMAGDVINFLFSVKNVQSLIRISVLGSNPIGTGLIIAIGLGMLLIFIHRSKISQWIILIPIVGLMAIGLIATGSRGPIFSLIAGIAVYFVVFEKINIFRISISLFLLLFIFGILFLILPESITYRFINYTTGDLVIYQDGVKHVSTIALRFQYWQLSLSEWFRNIRTVLVGVGAGGFSSFYILRDYTFYPHNMFFEILLELGIIGVSIIVLFFSKVWLFIINYKDRINYSLPTAFWIIAALITFFAAQFSGDIARNRTLWMFTSFAITAVYYEKRKYLTQIEKPVK